MVVWRARRDLWSLLSRRGVDVLEVFFSSRRRHTRLQGDWSSDVCSSDLIRLSGFNEKTDGELGEAMKQLNASTLDGLILDMRGNPGGLLDEAIAVGDMLLEIGRASCRERV